MIKPFLWQWDTLCSVPGIPSGTHVQGWRRCCQSMGCPGQPYSNKEREVSHWCWQAPSNTGGTHLITSAITNK